MLLEVKNLKTYFFTRYGVVKAVDGVNFSIDRGETLGIVGESGSGKSVTASSIVRLIPRPAARIMGGEIWFEGRNLLAITEKEMREVRGKHIGIILQDPLTSLNPVFSVGYQIAEPLKIHRHMKGGALTREVARLLRLVGIPEPESRAANYPFQYSGGMRQRVVGAIALTCKPSLLIADEPTTSLDVTVQAQYLNLLRELQQQLNLGIIFITHDFGIVAKMCNRLAIMYAGRIVETGEVVELFDRPAHPYTEALLRSVPRLHDSVGRLYQIEGQPPHLDNLPPGCSFAPRCPSTMDRCRKEYPPLTRVSPGHAAICWRIKA